ncbi:MAG TPA: alkaline phosphatase PhoX [Longimicrobiales bacterium]|nr:alkaline phosphatase PhoX [Longimicrobiales bacterium]
MVRPRHPRILEIGMLATAVVAAACERDAVRPEIAQPPRVSAALLKSGSLDFEPLASSFTCTVSGGDAAAPLALPAGFRQTIVAREGDGGSLGNWDMNTLNETGPDAGRYLYRTTEIGSNGQVIVTDLRTSTTRVLATDPSWGSLDGIVWTPWGTLLIGEERSGGRVLEVDPRTGAWHAVPAFGLRAHEGLRFDAQGSLYGISETGNGHIFRFVPDRRNDLSSGRLYALRLLAPNAAKTGEAEWVPVDLVAFGNDSDAAAAAVGATTYGRPEDVEIATSTGNAGAQTLFVAVTSEHRVLAVDLREPRGGADHASAYVYDYVKPGLNTTSAFTMPDNLALDAAGNLFITEDPGGNFNGGSGKTTGDDIWVATPSAGGALQAAATVARFASLTDCDAEPTGIYFDQGGHTLYVNIQHRGGDGVDLALAVTGAK